MTQTGYICTKYDTIKKASKTEKKICLHENIKRQNVAIGDEGLKNGTYFL